MSVNIPVCPEHPSCAGLDPWTTRPDTNYNEFAEQAATPRRVTATRIAMPQKLTEEERLRRNARELAYYYQHREKRLEQKRGKERQKLTRKQSAEHRRLQKQRHPERVKARKKVGNRVTRKQWPPVGLFKCSDCDAQAQNYHHEDYSLWWSVEPLCRKCHGKRHRKDP